MLFRIGVSFDFCDSAPFRTSLGRAFLILTAVVVSSLPLPTVTIQAQSTKNIGSADFSSAEALIDKRIANDHVPSISVAVARNGEIVWEKGFGFANREKHIAATEHSMYSLASVTKLMTATAIMLLRDRKQIDLDQPINSYLGSAKLTSTVWKPSEATVRRVATHTAGLATYDNGYACRADDADCQDIMIRRFGVLVWRPGERFDYSNLGYGVLGEVIRHVSGLKYGDFLGNEILTPLGMTHCSVGIPPALEEYAAERYSASDGSPADWSANEPSSQEAASSVFCSAHDLMRFGMTHLKEQTGDRKAILTGSAIDEMQNSPVPADDGLHYGFGWWHEERFGYKVMYVSGGYSYASALLFTVPSERIVVVVLINSGQEGAQQVADEVVSSLVPTYRQNRVRDSHPEQKSSAPRPNLLASISGTWSGRIQTETQEVPLTLTIDKASIVHGFIASNPATVQEGAEYRDGQLRARISGSSRLYERDPSKALDLDLQLFLRSGGILNGGATTVPLSQPEWGTVTYFVQLRKK